MIEEVPREISKHLEVNENENNLSQVMECDKSSAQREIYSCKNLHYKGRKI